MGPILSLTIIRLMGNFVSGHLHLIPICLKFPTVYRLDKSSEYSQSYTTQHTVASAIHWFPDPSSDPQHATPTHSIHFNPI